MLASERRIYILDCLNKKSIVSLKEIAAELGISEITVRRDFEKLENAGKLKRIQGGAALEGYLDGAEMTMKQKENLNLSAKTRVAAKAAAYVRPGDCVFLDGGTSIAPIMDHIAGMKITIVTYNQLAIRKLVNPVATIHIIGGIFLPHYVMNVGPEAQETLERYHFDIAFLGCTGIVPASNMTYITDMESRQMKCIALANSKKKVLLVDASKFGKSSYLKFSEIDTFDAVLSDKPPEPVDDPRFVFV